MPAHRQVRVGGVEVARCRVDEVPLARVVLGQVEGGQEVQSPRGRRVPLGIKVGRQTMGELRDLGSRTDAWKDARCQPIHSRPVQNRPEGAVQLEIELPVARVVREHVSRI